jgi:hypothetical protein
MAHITHLWIFAVRTSNLLSPNGRCGSCSLKEAFNEGSAQRVAWSFVRLYTIRFGGGFQWQIWSLEEYLKRRERGVCKELWEHDLRELKEWEFDLGKQATEKHERNSKIFWPQTGTDGTRIKVQLPIRVVQCFIRG